MNKKHWGEFEDESPQSCIPKMNFNSVIELASQSTTKQTIPPKPPTIEMPLQNFAVHTVQLHQHSHQLRELLQSAKSALMEGRRLDVLNIPPIPEAPNIVNQHDPQPPLNYVEKDYCDFSKGLGPTVSPISALDKRKVLQQCAAISLAQIGVGYASRSVIDTLADALDHYLLTMTRLMRTVTDREASNVPSGFPDIMTKVFTELGISGLHEFYQNKVIRYHDIVMKRCCNLLGKCQRIASAEIPQELKLEDVPELHFPSALGEVFTPSLEPGFQMLHSLEQEELQGLDLLDSAQNDDVKMEVVEYAQQ